MSVVVVAAHPDDEILGAGATLARHARTDEVHAVVLSEGATSRYAAGMVADLEKAGRAAAERIGFASVRFEQLPDQRLDGVPLIEVTQLVEGILDELAPTVVYTHFPGDVNRDHGVVAAATWTACRPYRRPALRRLAAFETPSSTEWGAPVTGPGFTPTVFVDVRETLATKLAAMECYAGELRDYPHPRSLRALTERASYWGSVCGLEYAEPFAVLREVW
ncbi:MAG TPA: PIG-L deacetylase family protein [Kineosporiaceae bacterium]